MFLAHEEIPVNHKKKKNLPQEGSIYIILRIFSSVMSYTVMLLPLLQSSDTSEHF